MHTGLPGMSRPEHVLLHARLMVLRCSQCKCRSNFRWRSSLQLWIAASARQLWTAWTRSMLRSRLILSCTGLGHPLLVCHPCQHVRTAECARRGRLLQRCRGQSLGLIEHGLARHIRAAECGLLCPALHVCLADSSCERVVCGICRHDDVVR